MKKRIIALCLIPIVTIAATIVTHPSTETNNFNGPTHIKTGATLYIDSGATIANSGTATGFASGLTIGTTTIGSGTSGRVLYDNAGVLGELSATTIGTAVLTSTNPSAITFGRANADNTFDWLSAANFRTAIGAGTGSGDALVANPLSQFATTTSAQLAGVISDETGYSSGAKAMFSISPNILTSFTLTDSGPNVFTFQSGIGGGGDFAGAEVQLVSTVAGENVLALKNTNANGYSALVIRDKNNNAIGTLGYLNTPSGNIFADQLYFEQSTTGAAAKDFVWVLTQNGTSEAAFRVSAGGRAFEWFLPNNSYFKPTATDFSTLSFVTGDVSTGVRKYYISHFSDDTFRIVRDGGNGVIIDAGGNVTMGGSTSIGGGSAITSSGAGGALGALSYITPGTGIATALGVNVGSAGAPVLFNGAGGTPSSLTGTNISGTAASLTAGNATKWTTGRTIALTGGVTYTSGSLDGSGNVTGTATVVTNANLTGDVTSSGNATTLAAGSASNLNSGTLAVARGGTGVSNTGTLTNASNTTVTGGGTIALGGFTATIPASDTVAMLGQANTFTGANIFSARPVTLSGNQSAAAWTTTGTGLIQAAANYTDTSSSGTVAAMGVNVLNAPTFLASSATTYTHTWQTRLNGPPVSSTNVTQTNPHTLVIVDSTLCTSVVTGGLVVCNSLGSTGVGIGGGNIVASSNIQGAVLVLGGVRIENSDATGRIMMGSGTNVTRLQFNGSTASFPCFQINSGAQTITVGLADGTAGGALVASGTFAVTSTSTFTGAITNSSLTASKPVFTDASKVLVSGTGVYPVIVASTHVLAQTATNASIATYTTPNDGTIHSFSAGGYVNITAISAGTLTVQISFTDENNAAQTLTYFAMGVTSSGLTTTGFTGFSPMSIRCKDNTAITYKTSFTGVSITYDAGGVIESMY